MEGLLAHFFSFHQTSYHPNDIRWLLEMANLQTQWQATYLMSEIVEVRVCAYHSSSHFHSLCSSLLHVIPITPSTPTISLILFPPPLPFPLYYSLHPYPFHYNSYSLYYLFLFFPFFPYLIFSLCSFPPLIAPPITYTPSPSLQVEYSADLLSEAVECETSTVLSESSSPHKLFIHIPISVFKFYLHRILLASLRVRDDPVHSIMLFFQKTEVS